MLKRHYGHSSARHIAGLWLVNSRVKMGSWSDPSPIQYIHVYRYRYLHISPNMCVYIYIYTIHPHISPYIVSQICSSTRGSRNYRTHRWDYLWLNSFVLAKPPSFVIAFPISAIFFFWAIIHHIRWGRLGWLLGLSQSLQEWAPEIISWFTHPPNCQHMQIYHSTSVIKPSWPSYKPTCLSGDHFRCRAFHLEVCHSHGLIEGLGKAVPPIEVITPQS